MRTKSKSENQLAFTLTELMIVIAIIGLLAAIALPNLARARDNTRLSSIYDNLRVLEHAKDQWALDNNKATGTPLADTTILTGYFRDGNLHTVMSETYVPNPIGTNAEADLPAGVGLGQYGPGASIPAP
jgi:type IV pilus assembly protein PilA